MTDESDVCQVQGLQQPGEVTGKRVVVVAGCRLTGLAEPAPVICDNPVPGLQQDRDLLVPGPAAQRVPVDEYDWLAEPWSS